MQTALIDRICECSFVPEMWRAVLVRSLFDLTAPKARIARGLAMGNSVDDIAASGNVTRNTVRAQLQQVLEKTGWMRQAEVTALLTNMALGQDTVKV